MKPWKLILHGNEKYPFPLSIHTTDDAEWIARDGTVSSLDHAKLIVAACNAFQTAAERLGCDPIALAERLGDGGLAEAVDIFQTFVDRVEVGEVRSKKTYSAMKNWLRRLGEDS